MTEALDHSKLCEGVIQRKIGTSTGCRLFCCETVNGAETSFGGSPSCLNRELFQDESGLKLSFSNGIMKDLIKQCETPVCLYAFSLELFLLLKVR